jgi:hypothetical protein
MGHTEMVLAVAGVDRKVIEERTRQLASGNWSAFSPAERVAFAFARKQAKQPSSITARDFDQLVAEFGRVRAVEVLWWSCRCHYMTRVADAFQLSLERQNVFDGFLPSVTAKEP